MTKPNPAAQALGKLRWKGSTKAERSEAARVASAGRMVNISPARRREIARKASAAAKAKRDAQRASAELDASRPAG